MTVIEFLAKYSGVLILFKIVLHIIIDSVRRDGKITPKLEGGVGTGGGYLFPIRRHDNPRIDIWVVVANFAYALGLIILILYALTKALKV